MKPAIIIFVRNPVFGKVKTRLATSIGNEAALNVYLKLLHHTRQVITQVDADIFVYYAEQFFTSDLWSEIHAYRFNQQGFGLGERLQHACSQVSQLGYQHILVIGSDCGEITPKILEQGVELLEEKDICIGPAKDGGYYLIGFNKYYPVIFEKISWSTEKVCQQTCAQIAKAGLTVGLLPQLRDIDTVEDLHYFPAFNLR